MASPQLENGFTRIANELLNAIAAHPFNGTQYAILLFIVRETYGFGRKESTMSVGMIADRIKRNKGTVSREMKNLIRLNIVVVIDPATFETARTVKLNKDFDTWRIEIDATGSESVQSCESATGSETATQQVADSQPPSIIHKETIKETHSSDELISEWNKLPAIFPRVQKVTAKRASKIKARLLEQHFRDNWRAALAMIPASAFLRGETGWQADFDWFVANDNNYVKILEGCYSDKKQKPEQPISRPLGPSLEERERIGTREQPL